MLQVSPFLLILCSTFQQLSHAHEQPFLLPTRICTTTAPFAVVSVSVSATGNTDCFRHQYEKQPHSECLFLFLFTQNSRVDHVFFYNTCNVVLPTYKGGCNSKMLSQLNQSFLVFTRPVRESLKVPVQQHDHNFQET